MPKCSVPCSTEMVSWKKDCRNKSALKGQHYKWEYLREIPQEVQGGEGDGCMWTLFSKYLFTHQYQFDNLIILLTSCVSWTHNTWWMSLSTSNISCLCKHTCTTHVWNVDKISFTRSIKANMKPTNPPPLPVPASWPKLTPHAHVTGHRQQWETVERPLSSLSANLMEHFEATVRIVFVLKKFKTLQYNIRFWPVGSR